MTTKITPAKAAEIVAFWHTNPFDPNIEIAKLFGVRSKVTHDLYPFDRGALSLRLHQAVRYLTIHGGEKNAALHQKYGFSCGLLACARKIVKSDRRYALTGHAPKQVAAEENPPAVTSPEEKFIVEKSFRGVIDVAKLTTERGRAYGHPLDDFKRVSAGKDVLAACPDPEVRHALEMIWVKMCRLVITPDHADSIDDIAGYAETIHMIHAERERRG